MKKFLSPLAIQKHTVAIQCDAYLVQNNLATSWACTWAVLTKLL